MRLLNKGRANELGETVLDALEELGYEAEELIPALVCAAYKLANMTAVPEQALDEAAELLADGFPEEGEEGD